MWKPQARASAFNVRFVRPSKNAIVVYAVNGLVVASCRIDGFTPLPNLQFSGIGIDSSDTAVTPTPSQPGHPENISGRILIADNDIDAGENPRGTCSVSSYSVRGNRQTGK
jgi:hypothetical protein